MSQTRRAPDVLLIAVAAAWLLVVVLVLLPALVMLSVGMPGMMSDGMMGSSGRGGMMGSGLMGGTMGQGGMMGGRREPSGVCRAWLTAQ